MSSPGKDQYLPRRRHITHVRINDNPHTINDVPQTEYRPLSKISAHGSTLSDYQPKILRTQSDGNDNDLLVYRKNSADVNYLRAVIREGFSGDDSPQPLDLSSSNIANRRKDGELKTPRRPRPFRHSFVRAVNRSDLRTTEELAISEGAPAARQVTYRKWSSAESLGPSDSVIHVTLTGKGMVISTNGVTHDSTSFHTYPRDHIKSKERSQGRRVKRIASFFGSVRRGVAGGWQKRARKKQKRRNAVRRHVSLPSMKLFRRLKKPESKEETQDEKSPLYDESRKEQESKKVATHALSPALARFNEFLRSSHESVGGAGALEDSKGTRFANALDSISIRVQRLKPKRIKRWFSDRLLSPQSLDSNFETSESSEELVVNGMDANMNGVSHGPKLGRKHIVKQNSFKESFSKGLQQIASRLEKLRRQRLFRSSAKRQDGKVWVSEDNLAAFRYLSKVRYGVNNITVIELKFDDDNESNPVESVTAVPQGLDVPTICINADSPRASSTTLSSDGEDEPDKRETESMGASDSEYRAPQCDHLEDEFPQSGYEHISFMDDEARYVNNGYADSDALSQSSDTTEEPNVDTSTKERIFDENKTPIDRELGVENNSEFNIYGVHQLDYEVDSVDAKDNDGLCMDSGVKDRPEESDDDYLTTPVARIPVPPRLPDVKVGTWPREHCRSTAAPPIRKTGRRKDSKDFQTELTAKILAFQTRLRLTYPEETA